MSINLGRRIATLEDVVVELLRRNMAHQRQLANLVRPGRVTEVDAEKGLVKVAWSKDDQDQDVISGWIPWTTRAGKIKDWNPPSVDEQVMLYSPTGDIGPASWVMAGGYSNKNPQNHDKDGERLISIGSTSMLIKDGQVLIKAKNYRVEAGKVEYEKKPPSAPGELPSYTQPAPGVDLSDVPMS